MDSAKLSSDKDTRRRKQSLRSLCRQRRSLQLDKDTLSQRICRHLVELREYHDAQTLSTYVSLPEEVQTLELITRAWSDRKKVVVPYCANGRLSLFHLKSLKELAPRTLGILEPHEDLRQQTDRWCTASEVDLFVVPGLAFDHRGGRLGCGKGYYDRLLSEAPMVAKIALAFGCQIVSEVPMESGDVFMSRVVTEDPSLPMVAETTAPNHGQ